MLLATPSLRLVGLLALLLAFAAPLAAQPTGSCTPGSASAVLDVNDVEARLYTNGNLFWQGGDPLYEVPKGEGVQAIFAQGLWVAGEVGGELRIAAATYGDYEFWPGPLDESGAPPADCSAFDRVWVVSREDVATFEDTDVATLDLIEWPADLGAPVLDGDGDPDNYDLAGGDRPLIKGDQSAWWVTNDAGNTHATTGSAPIGLEVTTLAYASNLFLLRTSTFYEYTITYRGAEPLENTYVAVFADPDLGDFNDDYIGSDPVRGLGYVYNGDLFDSPANGGYGNAPPALGYDFLQGPIIDADVPEVGDDAAPDTLGISYFTYFNNGACSDICDPDTGEEFYHYMTGRWKDGTPLEFGGDGYSDTEEFETNFAFPGDPPAYWSEEDTDSDGTANPPGDRRFVISTGPFTLQPGESQTITLGILWARGVDRFDSIAELKALDDEIQALYENDALAAEDALPEAGFAVGAAFPNPFVRGHASGVRVPFRLDVPGRVEATVYDVLGRRVALLLDTPQPAGVQDLAWTPGAALPSGVYFVRVQTDAGTATAPVVLR